MDCCCRAFGFCTRADVAILIDDLSCSSKPCAAL